MALEPLAGLDDISTALWQELARAPRDKHHDWRTPVLATVDGDAADARTVVLREVDVAAQTLLFFSDARAGKLAQLQAHPIGTLVMWSARLSWQLRLRVRLAAQTDGLAVSSRWARLSLSPAAQDYLAPQPPGSVRSDPAASHQTPNASLERGHFAVLTAQVLGVDWLELRAGHHRRARFDAEGARWLEP
jgi:pyridoxamine 5'-phosphate oxidase